MAKYCGFFTWVVLALFCCAPACSGGGGGEGTGVGFSGDISQHELVSKGEMKISGTVGFTISSDGICVGCAAAEGIYTPGYEPPVPPPKLVTFTASGFSVKYKDKTVLDGTWSPGDEGEISVTINGKSGKVKYRIGDSGISLTLLEYDGRHFTSTPAQGTGVPGDSTVNQGDDDYVPPDLPPQDDAHDHGYVPPAQDTSE